MTFTRTSTLRCDQVKGSQADADQVWRLAQEVPQEMRRAVQGCLLVLHAARQGMVGSV